MVRKVFKVLREQQVLMVCKEYKEYKEYRAMWEQLVRKEYKVPQV
jgi:hypothetical protein